MLPEDAKQRKEAAMDKTLKAQQTVLSDHFSPPDADIIPYSDRAFEAAAIEWLIHSNQVRYFILVCFVQRSDPWPLQPIQTFKSAMFKKMLDIASRASHGVTLPSPKKTRVRIINMFKQQMYMLRDRLNVRVHAHCLNVHNFALTSVH
jgi:hypothetical protein